ncbi:hypothetical protein ACLKA6_010897 [Drosophila palustris]
MFSRNWRPCELDFSKERLWQLSLLKRRCKEADVEKEYILYEKRIRSYSLWVFLVLHSAVIVVNIFLLLGTSEHPIMIYFDVVLYFLSTLWIVLVLSINFKEEIVQNRSWVAYVTSVIAVMTLVAVDLTLNMYHYNKDDWTITSTFDTYTLYMIYLFLPISTLMVPTILGIAVSIIYIMYYFFELSREGDYRVEELDHFNNIVVNLIDYISFNLLGIIFRIMSDITIRSSFLDRHQYVLEDIALVGARKQEKMLLHSILPPQIAQPFQDDIRSRVAISKKRIYSQRTKEHIMAIQNHPDVTILYADVVNYTHLTTTLSVQELVTLLHDLYASFDYAASHYRTQRIKFLGDCYYCVAGLSVVDPDHAKCCINLGHCMIGHIRQIRRTRNLNIDMRIGIHSGSLLAGVIGSAKLQYDIWGEDVVIANKLESTGLPGHLHISERTLSMLSDHPYEILPGTQVAREDPLLIKSNIQTYLIAAIDNNAITNLEMPTTFHITKSAEDDKDRKDYVKQELRKEFELMPIGAFYEKKLFTFGSKKPLVRGTDRPMIGFLLLDFKDPRLEYNYINQTDYMLKYSILLSCCCLFFIADEIQRNLIFRICIYMIIIIMYFIVLILLLMDCEPAEYIVLHTESKLFGYEMGQNFCFHPWVLTKMICLIMGVTLIFTGIPVMVKIVVSVMETITYLIIINFQFDYLIHHSIPTNPFFAPEYAHGLFTVVTWFIYYYMERQVEFNNKINFNWRIELLKKQEDAHITNKSITILLHNILPSHVVNVYLTLAEKHELYYESYSMVAVMFATLKNFQMDMSQLRVLNEIISEFDTVLSQYRNEFLVDKIKIVGCTYMAACGLNVRHSVTGGNRRTVIKSLRKEVNRAQQSLARNRTELAIVNEDVVFILSSFALDLMRTLWICNHVYSNIPLEKEMSAGDMSIGISSGEVMAGVVGASQVHYDIWGNAVNMASRMDSTGVAGHIQVTEESAMILKRSGVECDFRGMTYVKGRGIMPTYFVGIDKNLDFRHTPEEEYTE